MRALMNGQALLAAALLLSTLSARAEAQPVGNKADISAAKTAFKAGQELMKMERYAAAIVEFRKAHAITKDDLVLGQIALAYEKAGDYQAALTAIQRYRAALPESDRGSVDELVKRYKEAIAAGRSKKLLLPGEQSAQQAQETAEAAKGADVDAARPKSKKLFWTWIAAGTAGAFTVGALALGLSAKSKFDDLESSCKPQCAENDVNSVKGRALASDVMWGLAAASAISAGVLFFVERGIIGSGSEQSDDKSDDSEEEDDEWDEEEEEELSQRLRLTPLVGAGQFGIGATLRY